MKKILALAVAVLFAAVFYFAQTALSNPAGTEATAAAVAKIPDQIVIITRIVDGDTVVIEGGQKVRLLGIDTDERGEPCYNTAKTGLAGMILNRRVRLQSDGQNKDRYDRLLRWIWLNETNINVEMVAKGLAVARFEQPVLYQNEVAVAEKAAIENRMGCKWQNFTG